MNIIKNNLRTPLLHYYIKCLQCRNYYNVQVIEYFMRFPLWKFMLGISIFFYIKYFLQWTFMSTPLYFSFRTYAKKIILLLILKIQNLTQTLLIQEVHILFYKINIKFMSLNKLNIYHTASGNASLM